MEESKDHFKSFNFTLHQHEGCKRSMKKRAGLEEERREELEEKVLLLFRETYKVSLVTHHVS